MTIDNGYIETESGSSIETIQDKYLNEKILRITYKKSIIIDVGLTKDEQSQLIYLLEEL